MYFCPDFRPLCAATTTIYLDSRKKQEKKTRCNDKEKEEKA